MNKIGLLMTAAFLLLAAGAGCMGSDDAAPCQGDACYSEETNDYPSRSGDSLGAAGSPAEPPARTLNSCLAECPEPTSSEQCRTACTSDGICATGDCRQVTQPCPSCDACRNGCRAEFSASDPVPRDTATDRAPASSALSCGELVSCVNDCDDEDNEDCFRACVRRSCQDAAQALLDVLECYSESCDEGDRDCLEEACDDEISDCVATDC